MRYRIRGKLLQPIRLTRPFQGVLEVDSLGGLRFEFEPDESGSQLTAIAVSTTTDMSQHENRLEPSTRPGVDYVATFRPDPDLRGRLEDALDAVDAHVSFIAGTMVGVDRTMLVDELVPETEDERAQIGISSVAMRRQRPPPDPRLDPTILPVLVKDKLARLGPLVALKQFDQEGSREHYAFRWIQSFYNYYFVLEGLYANGKSSEKEVLRQFGQSDELRLATERALGAVHATAPGQEKRLEDIAQGLGQRLDPQGVYVVLLRYRGRLHHYQSSRRSARWTPLRQEEFEPVARLGQGIAMNALLLREAELNGTPDMVWWARARYGPAPNSESGQRNRRSSPTEGG